MGVPSQKEVGEDEGGRVRSGLVGRKPTFAAVVAREGVILGAAEEEFRHSNQEARALLARLMEILERRDRELAEALAVARCVVEMAEAHEEAVRQCGATPLCRRYPVIDPPGPELRARAARYLATAGAGA